MEDPVQSPPLQVVPSKQELRDQLDEDVQNFLASGGKIQKIPMYHSINELPEEVLKDMIQTSLPNKSRKRLSM
jgi:hypothetical protein